MGGLIGREGRFGDKRILLVWVAGRDRREMEKKDWVSVREVLKAKERVGRQEGTVGRQGGLRDGVGRQGGKFGRQGREL